MTQAAAPSLNQVFLGEFMQELESTRTVLDRIPEDRLTWKPHEKSMTAGQLGLHIANVPAGFAEILSVTEFPLPEFTENAQPESKQEILDALDAATEAIRKQLESMTDEEFHTTWHAVKDGTPVISIPKAGVARAFLLNHWYHHRGQLSVYLRMLDVPVPSVYGPTADENPFA